MKHSLRILIYLLLGRMEKYNGQGTRTFPDGRKFVGEFKNDEYWNITGYDKNGNIIIKVVNGKLESE